LTLACAQCHDHKYDPLSRQDYYQFFAYFNNVPETGKPPLGGQYNIADPWIYVGSPSQRAREQELLAGIESAKLRVVELENAPATKAAQREWEADALKHPGGRATLTSWQALGPFEVSSFDAAYATMFEPEKTIDLTRTYCERQVEVDRTCGVGRRQSPLLARWLRGHLPLPDDSGGPAHDDDAVVRQ
jgi:hypothetical protein